MHQAHFVSLGTCPYVGTGGHLGCGGFGFPSRNWGLALDAVIKAQVVLANGSIVTASATENQDLFFVSLLSFT
jgi:FAD/FMN-containing dehydrogenase